MNKKTLSNIILALGIIIVVILGIWLFAYLPNVGSAISTANADWGYFGEFFWDLGTMLLTGLSVLVLYKVNESLNEFNENLQQKQIEFEKWLEEGRQKFQIEMENKRREIQKEKIRLKRFENWLEKYYELILRLTSSKLSSDIEWLDILRELTIIYRAILADNLIEEIEETKPIIEKLQKMDKDIRNTIVHASVSPKPQGPMLLFYQNLGLSTNIIQLYFEMLSLKNDLPKISEEDFFSIEKKTIKRTTKSK